MANPDQALRDELFAEVEVAWIDRRDATVVDRLAAEHPDLAEELYDWFADLFSAERPERRLPLEVEDALGESLERWFEEHGRGIAREAAAAARGDRTPPTDPTLPVAASGETLPQASTEDEATSTSELPFLSLLEEQTGLDADEIAEAIGDCSAAFLMLTERYPALYPPRVRAELAARAERLWNVAAAVCLRCFEHRPQLRLAASRKKGYSGPPRNFDELLRRADLTLPQHRYWAELAKGG